MRPANSGRAGEREGVRGITAFCRSVSRLPDLTISRLFELRQLSLQFLEPGAGTRQHFALHVELLARGPAADLEKNLRAPPQFGAGTLLGALRRCEAARVAPTPSLYAVDL